MYKKITDVVIATYKAKQKEVSHIKAARAILAIPLIGAMSIEPLLLMLTIQGQYDKTVNAN